MHYNGGMALRPVSFRWDSDLLERIDAARGSLPRAAWVREAIEMRLDGGSELALPPPAIPAIPKGGLVPTVHRPASSVRPSAVAHPENAPRRGLPPISDTWRR